MPRYSKEFREQAVERVKSSGRSINAICKELGVSHKTLCIWVRQAEAQEAGGSGNALQELKKARRRIRELEMEREILKKAAAFFAKENR